MRNTGKVLSHSCSCLEMTQKEAHFWSLPPETTLNEPCFESFIYMKFNLLTLRQNKNNNFMFQNKKVMANQKTLIIPQKTLPFSFKLMLKKP